MNNNMNYLRLNKSTFSILVLLVLGLIFAANSEGQNKLYDLGEIQMFSSIDIKQKQQPLLLKAAIGKMHYSKRVGGVSFEQVAVPSSSLEDSNISLIYDSLGQDGSRFLIAIGDDKDSIYTMSLPDWQLVPIAHFAADTNHAVVTMLGGINYHPAFTDNLMGLRMLQADMILIKPETWDLPRNPFDTINHAHFIADSELAFKPDLSRKEEYLKLHDVFSKRYGTSYIFTDWGQEIKFGVYSNSFYLTGEPYYLMTKRDADHLPYIKYVCSTFRQFDHEEKRTKFPELCKICENENFNWQYDQITDLIRSEQYDIEGLKSEFRNEWLKISNISVSTKQDVLDSINNIIGYEDFIRLKNNLDHSYNVDYDSFKRDITQLLKEILNQNDLESELKEVSELLMDPDFGNSNYQRIQDILDSLYWYSPSNSELKAVSLQLSKISLGKKVTIDLENYKVNSEFNDLLNHKEMDDYDWSGYYYSGKETVIDLLLKESEELAENADLLYQFNPAIYDASTKVMRYAAFFRYVKENQPASWNNFMRSLLDKYPVLEGEDHYYYLPDDWPKPAPLRPDDPVNKGFITPTNYR